MLLDPYFQYCRWSGFLGGGSGSRWISVGGLFGRFGDGGRDGGRDGEDDGDARAEHVSLPWLVVTRGGIFLTVGLG